MSGLIRVIGHWIVQINIRLGTSGVGRRQRKDGPRSHITLTVIADIGESEVIEQAESESR